MAMAVLADRYGAQIAPVAVAHRLRVSLVVIIVPFALTYGGFPLVAAAYRPNLPLNLVLLVPWLAIGWLLGEISEKLRFHNGCLLVPIFLGAALTAVAQAGKETPVVTGQDSEVESVKSIVAGEQYSTIYKDTRELVAQTIATIQALQAGEDPDVNDTESYDNDVKIVPAYLLTPLIVTQENAAEVYANDELLAPLTQE